MGNLIERIGERKKGIIVETLPDVNSPFDIRLGEGWFGEVTKKGNSESLRWTSQESSLAIHNNAVSDLAQILTGTPHLLMQPSGYQIKATIFIEPKDGEYRSEREFNFPYAKNSSYIKLRTEGQRINDGRKLSIIHKIKDVNGTFVFSLQTVMHPPHGVSEVILDVADKYTEKWPNIYTWISSRHANREKFGI